MKKTIKFFTAILIVFFVLSCSSDDDNNSQSLSVEIVGNWSGTFSGEDTGTWNINVSESGEVTGTGFSTTFQENYIFEGSVNLDGQLNATVGTSSTGATFVGVLNTNGTGSGTWNNSDADLSGNWEGNKD
ncbi:MAG: hypothetical protein HRT67_02920 [Flavobacteriaceae bacterium]|nr:hypothetical protein [Flavobacteriaceae bacterium]